MAGQGQGIGGRHYRGDYVDQNFDSYSVEYTFADETKFLMEGRYMWGCKDDQYHSFAHGSKGTAIISRSGDCGGPSATFKGLGSSRKSMIWQTKGYPDDTGPYGNEWNDLVFAIRNDKPYNEVKRGVEASLVTSMGRMAAHTGRIVTFDQMLNSTHQMAPGLENITAMEGPAPLRGDKNKRYPVPQPGIVTDREYA